MRRDVSAKSQAGLPLWENGCLEADSFYMKMALEEATRAAEEEEIPVGAVVVREGRVIGSAHNMREGLQNPVAHAEMLALQAGSSHQGTWRLSECTLYVTLEPCVMCVGAILQARIARLVFGCLDPKGGAARSLYRLCEDSRLNHQLVVTGGVLEVECGKILTDFFARLRAKDSKVTRTDSPN